MDGAWRGDEGDSPFDTLAEEVRSPLGPSPLAWVAAGDAEAASLPARTRAVVVGLDRAGTLPELDGGPYDCLLTTADEAPAPWVSITPSRWDRHLLLLAARVVQCPIAASTLVAVLRMAALPFDLALAAESHAYSMLLAGEEFARWRRRTPRAGAATGSAPPIRVSRDSAGLTVTLSDPARRNAFTASMRDALFDALAAVLDDPTAPALRLTAAGACFSVGGGLDEFGSAGDVAVASAIRLERSCARLLARLGERATVILHGACIGSGIEIPAAAAHRVARADSWFQLPELGMGLIPGAGGCTTISRAIGRHRTAWMVLSGARVNLATALRWGLVTEVAA